MRALLLAAIAAVMAGCGGEDPPAPGGDRGCAGCQGCCDGDTCLPGDSVAACGTAGAACVACGGGETCTAGACKRPDTGASTAGDACTADADCGPGARCADVAGGGYCTSDCAGAPCGAGAVCAQVGGAAVCLRGCDGGTSCRAEHLCQGGVCLPRCTHDADCESLACDTSTGECADPVIGAACAEDSGCGDAPLFCGIAPGGYCTARCGGPGNETCPAGSVCSSALGGSLCLSACTGDGDCREGYLCWDDGAGVRACLPRCTSDGDCGAGECDLGSGLCRDRGGAPGSPGTACEEDQDCGATPGEAYCSPVPPGGSCTSSCTDDHSICGEGATCVVYPSGNAYCMRACDDSSDCRPEYACQSLGEYRACFERCSTDRDCSPQSCDPGSGTCYDRVPGAVIVDTVDLTPAAPVTVYTDRLATGLKVTVPADAVSLTFVGEATDPTKVLTAYRIVGPDGATYYDRGGLASRMPVMPPLGAGAFAVTTPLTPVAPFGPGTWTLYMLASGQTTARAKALIKRAPSPPQTGRLDLNVFFVGVPGLDAAGAPGSRDLQVLLGRLFETLGSAGLERGEVTYIDLTGNAVTAHADLRISQLGELVRLSADARAREGALNVFLVRSISGGGLSGEAIVARSAGIPGIPVNGTTGSGVALSMADFPLRTTALADTLAHEVGHFLGLFHTTESQGTSFDPLADTPECPAAEHDASGNGIMEAPECFGYGADDLMFWTESDEINRTRLTPNQWFVLLRSPLVR